MASRNETVHHVDGEAVVVRRNPRRTRNAAIFRDNGHIVLELPSGVSRADEPGWAARMLERLRRHEKRRQDRSDGALLTRALALRETYLLPVVPAIPMPVSVTWSKTQGKRWGSCASAARTIRLSSRLKDFPDWVVDYVLLHELAHLVESGHGPAFWALLQAYPRMSEAKGFLNGYSAGLAARSNEPMAGEVDEDGD
ncbi:SprT-like domain-containing protein [Granulicoccus sp. GXG6511]|uniref:M48 family metallopeptidase n=1 Tax=Granulicoccus sp. GXG6511 TaxID=3381351 RepID=UPI003D7C9AC1